MKDHYFPSSKTIAYRIPIRTPSLSKIQMVAAYKKQEYSKKQQDQSLATNNNSISNRNHSKSTASVMNPANVVPLNVTPIENSTSSSVETNVSNGDKAQLNAKKIEELKTDYDELQRFGQLVVKDIRTLSSIRQNILWILRKSTAFQNSLHHKGIHSNSRK